jgi:hypothetical protein
MLIHETRRIVHLVVHNDVAVLLRCVFRDVRVCEFLSRHCVGCFVLEVESVFEGCCGRVGNRLLSGRG